MDMMTGQSMDSAGHCRGSFFTDPVLIIAGLTLSEVYTPPSEGHLWQTRASFFTENFSQLLPSPSSATSSTFSCHFAKTLQVCLEPFPISLTCDLTTTFTHVWRRPSGFPSGCSWAPCRCNLCKLLLLGGATSKPKRGDTDVLSEPDAILRPYIVKLPFRSNTTLSPLDGVSATDPSTSSARPKSNVIRHGCSRSNCSSRGSSRVQNVPLLDLWNSFVSWLRTNGRG